MALEIIRAPMCIATVKLENGELETGMVDVAEVGRIVTIIGKDADGSPCDFTGEVVAIQSER